MINLSARRISELLALLLHLLLHVPQLLANKGAAGFRVLELWSEGLRGLGFRGLGL